MLKVRKKLGDILIEAGKITNEQLMEALDYQKVKNLKIGQALVALKYITQDEIIDTLSKQLLIDKIDLKKEYIEAEVARSIPKSVAQKYNLIPIKEENNKIILAISDPLNMYAIDDVQFITRKTVVPKITDEESIKKAIDVYYDKQTTDKALKDLQKEFVSQNKAEIDQDDIIDDVQSAPAVRLVNSIINQAVTMKASDIHIEPFAKEVIVRFRIDGVLSNIMDMPLNTYSAVCTRFKIMSSMDIAERRKPQDGRIEMDVKGSNYDFRVSSLPTVFGEKLVLRILDRSSFLFHRNMLGFTQAENTIVDKLQYSPYGIVLVTGPTGSGKTTTLYTLISEQNTPEKNIVTVEDPVEYMIKGINQVQVNNKAGLTFASGLRSILRQDPDTVMVGEIRDEETAQIAVRSAITGHMVFSTLHTNDAPSSVTRLINMGVEPYLVADSLIGVIAQRLVRKLCPDCKIKYMADDSEKKILGLQGDVELYKANGCKSCNNSGYSGRTAIHEIMVIDKEMKVAIQDNKNSEILRNLAEKKGMATLYDNCKLLVQRGITTIHEMVKTVYARD